MNNYAEAIQESAGRQNTLSLNGFNRRDIAKIFVLCDQKDTAPVWGYILRQQGLQVILETSLEKAIDRWSAEILALTVLDINGAASDRLMLYKTVREQSVVPLLLLLPVYHEAQILDAYAAGVDDVVIKPVSPPVFLAKIKAWVRRSWTAPVASLDFITAGNYRLHPARRSMVTPDRQEVPLTNLEFHLLHLLMGRPGGVFAAQDIIQSIWGVQGEGDQMLLKNVVYRLRKKIESDPSHPVLLQTRPGGYSFQG